MARPTKKKSDKKEPVILTSENVKIEIRPFEKDNLLGFATLTLYEDIKIYNCRIVYGKNGPFLSMPSYQGSDDKYYNYCYIDKDSDLAKEINDLVATSNELPFE